MHRLLRHAAGMTAFAAMTASAGSGDIVQDSENFFSQINAFAPIGQTFTALRGDYTRFGFYYEDCNSSGLARVDFTLRAGAGTSGSVLAQATRTDVGGLVGYVEFPLNGVAFVPGQVYTALVTTPSERGCYQENVLFVAGAGPDYGGGAIVYQGVVNAARGDLRFFVFFDDPILAAGFEDAE